SRLPEWLASTLHDRRVERTAVELGRLRFVPVTQAIELVGGPVQDYVHSTNVRDGLWVSEIDPDLADTAAFCEHYDIGLDISANCVSLRRGAPTGSGTPRVSCSPPRVPTSTASSANTLVPARFHSLRWMPRSPTPLWS